MTAIDPKPAPELERLANDRPELELVREPSHEALERLEPAGAVIVDGDHNHHTVSRELELIAGASKGARMPLVLLHDVGWPHARRDTYYDPERIPEAERQPLARDAILSPDSPGTSVAGIHYPWAAATEGGEANGVLTAVESFAERHPELRLAVIPAFFGLGVLWPKDADWSGAVEDLVGPWDRNPVLERLEHQRVERIVDRDRLRRRNEALGALLGSRAFALAERLSRLRGRGDPAVSREAVRKTLDD